LLIAGGGTGGHLFPGIALAEHVARQGGETTFVGTEKGIEARVVPDQGYPLELIEVAGIKGRGLSGLFGGLSRLPRAYFQSRAILKRIEPDVVVGVGGYASGPIVATASTMGIPTAILEQNSVPGVTNRILGKLVRKVFTTFPDDGGFFPNKKVVMAGNPIRRELIEKLAAARERRNDDHAPRLFVFGGSQGARKINETIVESLAQLTAAIPELELWHQTGSADHEKVETAYAQAGLTAPRARVAPFIKDMAEPYAWCDLVVCRAGATSLSELAAVGCPAVLIPFPHAADNHQEHNARSLVDRGAAEMVIEAELSTGGMVAQVARLLGDKATLSDMESQMLAAAKPEAAAEIYQHLRELVGKAS
jgi:UDP-N-acetylglucosamine--N-acetylmuramyl-(pentapeptide) pyrophosphoryl-undecaprenol N-acetylglucosamine transferase